MSTPIPPPPPVAPVPAGLPAPRARPRLAHSWGSLGTLVRALLGIAGALCLAWAAMGVWGIVLLAGARDDPTSITPRIATLVDGGHRAASGLLFLLTLVTGVLFVAWVYRAHRSDQMDVRSLRHGSGWAVGGWFVPVLNFWRPLQMVLDLRRGAGGASFVEGRAVTVWWSLWLGSWLAGTVGANFRPPRDVDVGSNDELAALHASLLAEYAADLLAAVMAFGAAILAIRLVRDTTRLVETHPR